MGVSEFFAQQLRDNLKFPPTSCQERLFNELGRFVSGDADTDIMIVSGYAGTGKTSAIAAFVKTLKDFKYSFVLLAPTGRSAKVLSNFTGEKASTIHRHIYRQKSLKDGVGEFSLDFNKSRDTFFIVDEASLISISTSAGNIFGSGDLLDDLVTYVRSSDNNRLLIIGDPGQLPPVGLDCSPALDLDYMSQFGSPVTACLTTVVRQAAQSGILTNATIIRNIIGQGYPDIPQMTVKDFPDVERIRGGELIETLSDAFSKYGMDDTVVLCRSNKRANRYNAGIRSAVLYREERLTRGDKLMVVKNCYQFLEDIPELDFIANGDVAELVRISSYEERYGLTFADATLSFPDYNDVEIKAKIILDTLDAESPALSQEQQKALYDGVSADYADQRNARKRYSMIREDKYYNALQIKYATAITCHKSQGGQWRCVFIDNPFWQEPSEEDLKWLYTAVTRGVEKVYFISFKDEYFSE